jgi:hypothetical protein
MQSVESIVTAAVHLVAAFAPLGMGTLGILRTFTDLLSALPVDVLSNLATVGAAVFLGFKSYGILSVGVTALGTALEFVGVSAETAATGLAVMNIAAGAVAAVVAIAVYAFTAHAEAARQDQQAVNNYTDALRQSNGVIDENIRQMTVKTLTESGAMAVAQQYGISVNLVTSAALGYAGAQENLNTQMKAAQTNAAAPTEATQKYGAAVLGASTNLDGSTSALNTNTEALGGSNAAAGEAQQKLGVLSTAVTTNKDTLDKATTANKLNAEAMATSSTGAGTLTTATLLGMNAQQQSESANKSQTATITALNAAMDAELSKELSLAGATTGLDQATLTMNTTLKANKVTMDEHTQAGIDDRRAIEGVVTSLQSQRDANIKAGDSTADATTKYGAASAALLDQTAKMYGATSQAYEYMKKLLAIPSKVKSDIGITGDEVAKSKISQVQQKIDNLPGNKVITIEMQYTAGGVNLTAPSSVGRSATGGPISGPGTGTSDSILRLVSDGEHVLTADDVQAAGGHGAVMDWRKSLHGYAKGGPIILSLPTLSSIDAGLSSASSAGVKGLDVSKMFPAPTGGGGGGNAANKAIMQAMATNVFGWASQLGALDYLMMRESGYNNTAQNPTSTAYGMGQFLDSTWAGYGPKTSDPYLQSLYTLEYIKGRYVDANGAAAHERAFNWYGDGGMMMPGTIGMNEPGGKPERVMSGTQTEWFEAGRSAAGGGGGGNGATSADIAALGDRVDNLVAGFDSSLQKQARTIQTMQRQMARA